MALTQEGFEGLALDIAHGIPSIVACSVRGYVATLTVQSRSKKQTYPAYVEYDPKADHLSLRDPAGKSTTVHNLLRSLVDGDDFLGEFAVTTARKVALLDFERSASERGADNLGGSRPRHPRCPKNSAAKLLSAAVEA
ncbi:hypothetical protein [Homoserinibacter gongjuensis]|uniref:Uncharacterized protein n=1 Tax=Homoserinibacter gongjuensis TaxID=1162968 RepID=A0ABQ6JQM3_9MICO|nr:hypothetical protein [Homoserinibacter gongjuensis]GMA89619.1 hypothetical protein GCM10025869_01480 [Homoserinibacter gongjuensis]